MNRAHAGLILLIGWPHLSAAQAHHVTEREPNDTMQFATRIALSDSVSGIVSDKYDHDFFALDIPAGRTLYIIRTGGNVRYLLYDRDGITILSGLEPDYVIDHPEKDRFTYPITVAGTYFIRASAPSPDSDEWITGPYALVVETAPLELHSGDPVAAVAPLPEIGVGAAHRMISGAHGEIFVFLRDSSRILKIGPDGERSTMHTDLRFSGGFALSASGDLLVSAGDPDSTNSIWRIDPVTGNKDKLVQGLGPYYSYDGITGFTIAVGPNGDFWAGQVTTVWHFDPEGRLLSSVTLPRSAPAMYALAISPTGIPYYTYQGRGILRINSDGSVTQVSDSAGELAFDRDGNLYVGVWGYMDGDSAVWGHVIRFDPTLSVSQPIAYAPYLQGLIFLRDARGEMTSRMLTVQKGWLQRIVELAGANERLSGSGVHLEQPSLDAIAAALLGGPPLSPAFVTSVDRMCNANGRLDVGDLRCYARSQGLLTPTR